MAVTSVQIKKIKWLYHRQLSCNFWLSTKACGCLYFATIKNFFFVTIKWSEYRHKKELLSHLTLYWLCQVRSIEHAKTVTFGGDSWLSVGQLQHYFRFSEVCFGCLVPRKQPTKILNTGCGITSYIVRQG